MAATPIFLSGAAPVLSTEQKRLRRLSHKENSARVKARRSGPVTVIFTTRTSDAVKA